MNPDQLRHQILDLVRQFAIAKEASRPFKPGVDVIAPSGKQLGPEEFASVVDASLDGWLTTGRFNQRFEEQLASFLGVPFVLTCNSGSSANLLALSALTSPQLGDRALKPGDEVITAAAGFPTTINPILQNGLVPVFVDSCIPTYNPSTKQIAEAIGPRTRAIMLAHTLGNPFDLAAIKTLADQHGLWLIEDCCDALGAEYQGRKVGTWGDIGTLSFYPAHHITMGEGGAVFARDKHLKRIIESFRDWGRDCWCNPGCDNTCGQRFDWQLGQLPIGYDHKYIYSHVGYNLKITDMQAALGVAQLQKLDHFIEVRRRNFNRLTTLLQPLADYFILPEATANSTPSWFGFPLTLHPTAPFDRRDLLRFLDQRKIGTRLLFAGNVTRQPYFADKPYRISGNLTNADTIMQNTFWIGLWPGLEEEHLIYMTQSLSEFCGLNF